MSNNEICNLNGIELFKNLTHLSISFNNIENIEELDRISNKNLLTLLAVKGNFFCKNPISNILIINKFPNLKDLDDYKISEATFNVIEESKDLRCDIIPFLWILDDNLCKLEKIKNTILINLEIETKFGNRIDLEDKMNNVFYLMKIVGNLIFTPETINKYLVK